MSLEAAWEYFKHFDNVQWASSNESTSPSISRAYLNSPSTSVASASHEQSMRMSTEARLPSAEDQNDALCIELKPTRSKLETTTIHMAHVTSSFSTGHKKHHFSSSFPSPLFEASSSSVSCQSSSFLSPPPASNSSRLHSASPRTFHGQVSIRSPSPSSPLSSSLFSSLKPTFLQMSSIRRFQPPIWSIVVPPRITPPDVDDLISTFTALRLVPAPSSDLTSPLSCSSPMILSNTLSSLSHFSLSNLHTRTPTVYTTDSMNKLNLVLNGMFLRPEHPFELKQRVKKEATEQKQKEKAEQKIVDEIEKKRKFEEKQLESIGKKVCGRLKNNEKRIEVHSKKVRGECTDDFRVKIVDGNIVLPVRGSSSEVALVTNLNAAYVKFFKKGLCCYDCNRHFTMSVSFTAHAIACIPWTVRRAPPEYPVYDKHISLEQKRFIQTVPWFGYVVFR